MRTAKWSRQRLRVLLVKELRDLARDRKVFYTAILLPALLFPLLIAFSGRLFEKAEQTVTYQSVRIGLIGKSRALDHLVARTENATWARGGSKQQIRAGELDAVVLVARADGGPEHYTVLYDASRESSRSARSRVAHALETLLAEERARLLASAGAAGRVLPARKLDVVDLAPLDQEGKSEIPRFLPMLLVLILLSAAAFAAIDLFAGERERGTLETLLVQPMLPGEVLAAKYLAVFVIGVVAVATNLLGMVLSSAITSGAQAGLSLGSVLWLFVLSLPLALFLSALLVRVVARAKSVREAQNFLLPLTLVCLLPPFMAGSPDVPFDGFTACLPLAGPALAFREVSVGRFAFLTLALMVVATCAFSAVVLRGALKHLSNEEHLLRESGGGRTRPGRGLLVVLGSILGLYAVGPFLQGWSPVVALGLPLVLFVGLPPVLFGRWAGMPPRQLFHFRVPASRSLVVALSAGLGLAMLTTSIAALQQQILPVPKVFRDAADAVLGAESLPIPLLLLLAAVLPALLEELLYRRFLLRTLLKSTDSSRALAITAVLFALHHLSIFRLFPALAAGIVLGWVVLATRTFWTAPIVHMVSNGLVLLAATEQSPLAGGRFAELLTAEHWAIPRLPVAVALIVVPKLVLYRRQPWEPEPHAYATG